MGPRIVASGGRLEVRCKAGDCLFIDTGCWYHETSLPPCTPFSLSVAKDFQEVSSMSLEVGSMQQYTLQQLCAKCMTPTATPRGFPPGVCGCMCCMVLLEHRYERNALRRSTLLAQKVLAMQWEALL